MALERTFSIIKPDAVKRNLIGEIYHRIEKAGLADHCRENGSPVGRASQWLLR